MTEQVVEVRLFGKTLGALALAGGQIYFEYDPEFIGQGIEPSPVKMPVEKRVYQFAELNALPSFNGLPGLCADSLPDRFGHLVINKYFAEKGIQSRELNVLQRLAYLGGRAMGALEYYPSEDIPSAEITEAAEIKSLREAALNVLKGEASEAIPFIYQFGGSAGGARSKAIIAFNPTSKKVEIGTKKLKKGYKHYLLKFDGVQAGEPSALSTGGPWGKTEYVYSLMAENCGIKMPKTELIAEGERFHFLIERFDRVQNEKQHMHSLGGLAHSDFNNQRDLSYEIFFRLINQVVNDHSAIVEAFRRMVFNVVACNRDDHVKNFSFLMDKAGHWSLSPAYDVTFAYNAQWCSEHQMTIGGKSKEFIREDLLKVASEFNVPEASAIIDQCIESVSDWPKLAREYEIESEHYLELQRMFRLDI